MSIIVPIYNVARYLERCLDSIRNQSWGDFEVILVPNGGRDDDMKICKKYVEMDQRFSLIALKKKGVGRARNAGIDAASSEYIMFVDGDDTIEPNMVEKMLAPIENDPSIDMVQCGVNVFFEENFTCKYRDCDEIKKSDADYYKLKNTGKLVVTSDLFYNMNAAVQNKLFRKELINRYKVRYVDDLFAEDAYFVWCYFCICHNIFNIEDELCNYYRRKYSRMWGLFNKKFKARSSDHLIVAELFYDFLVQNNLFEKFKMGFWHAYLVSFWFSQNFSYGKFQKKIKKKVASFLKKEKLEIPNLPEYNDLRDCLKSGGGEVD